MRSAKPMVALILAGVLLAGCLAGGEEDLGALPTFPPSDNTSGLGGTGLGLGTDQLSGVTPAPRPTPTGRPIAPTEDDGRLLVWSFLRQCHPFEHTDLVAYPVKADWFVQAATGSRPQYGLWRVGGETGDVDPLDSLAREWRILVDEGCPEEDVLALAPPLTPTPPAPTPTQSPLPAATPVAAASEEARNLVWAHLGRCFSLDPAELDVNNARGDWYVRAPLRDLGIWRVSPGNGEIAPHDLLAGELTSYLESRCDPAIYGTVFPPTPTHPVTHPDPDTYPRADTHAHGHADAHGCPPADPHTNPRGHQRRTGRRVPSELLDIVLPAPYAPGAGARQREPGRGTVQGQGRRHGRHVRGLVGQASGRQHHSREPTRRPAGQHGAPVLVLAY